MCKYRVLCTTSRRTQPRHCSYVINLWPNKGMQRQVTWRLIFFMFWRFIFTIDRFDKILFMNWLYYRCRTEGELAGDDGENSMYFDMPVNLTTCHCIGPVHSDNNDNQGPLGGKYIDDTERWTFVLKPFEKFQRRVTNNVICLNFHSSKDCCRKVNAQKRRNVQALKNQTRWETIATKMMGIFGLCFTGLGFHPAPYYQCIAHLVNGMYWITMVPGDMALKQLYDVGQDTS